MSDDATLDQEGVPGMDAPNADQETDPPITDDGAPAGDAAGDDASQDERPKSKHELAMDLVAANRLRDLEDETGQTLSPPADSDDIPDEPPATKKRVVKVDGEEFDVSDDELVREYQKGRTADRRLEQAADERKRIQAESAALAAERAEFERLKASPRLPASPAFAGAMA